MNYWQFRIRLYHQSLKQWLDSIRQMSLAIVALFPLALFALVFFPFLAWGVMAESATNNDVWIQTLWGYLLFVYSLCPWGANFGMLSWNQPIHPSLAFLLIK